MPYVYTSQSTGDQFSAVNRATMGWKLTPFDKTQMTDKPYLLQLYKWLGGNGVLRSGGLNIGERDHLYTTSISGSVLYNTISIPYGPCSSAYARAYGKFKDEVYTQAANLTALAERAKTFTMVEARLKQLWLGARALKKGRFRTFLKTFGIKPLPKHAHKRWARPKEFSALWLEYWMGWAPTVGDVYTSLEFLGNEIPTTKVRAGSARPIEYRSRYTSSGRVQTSVSKGKVVVWIQADVVVTNPSLYNLNGLGLLNPAKTVWETIPFSWLFDWFTNVGQVLGRVTDWVGLELKNLVISSKTKGTLQFTATNTPQWGELLWRNREYTSFFRKVGGTLPVIKPIWRVPNGLSITRGLTLASLLTQLFAPSKA